VPGNLLHAFIIIIIIFFIIFIFINTLLSLTSYSSHFLACANFVIGLWAVKFCT
jgi:hypothetical protein